MLRTIWFFINATWWTIWHGSTVVVASLLGISNRENGVYEQAARNFSRHLLRAAGVKYRAVGQERVPVGEPVVFVGNHQSWFDVFLVGALLPGRLRFVAKRELMKVPIFGNALRACGHIVIDRQNRQRAFDAYEDAATYIKNGLNACVFAEGTRSTTGQLIPFKKGPFVLAIAAQVKVVPVFCAGTYEIMKKGSPVIRPGAAVLLYGDPIPTEGMTYEDRDALLQQTREAIESLRVDSMDLLG